MIDQDLKDIGVLLGHRRKMLAAIGELTSATPVAVNPLPNYNRRPKTPPNGAKSR